MRPRDLACRAGCGSGRDAVIDEDRSASRQRNSWATGPESIDSSFEFRALLLFHPRLLMTEYT
jgi:hypothetical protein